MRHTESPATPISRAAYYERYCPVSSQSLLQPANDPMRIHSKRFLSLPTFMIFSNSAKQKQCECFYYFISIIFTADNEKPKHRTGRMTTAF
ncbi:hypothetical protein CEXT_665271 [Caerostris extrusa]|uniref:Uncharacterized protein n=1 Tax=Caerostris extrusa TaxID=172846 RepID=A0AAV4RKF8_CAEEX|nr:hypothetical protein CEXT_665271 [Caerostris extrusa]